MKTKKLRIKNPDTLLKSKLQKLGAKYYRASMSWLIEDTEQTRRLLGDQPEQIPEVTPLPCLRDHQVQAVEKINEIGSLGIWFDCGTGKTLIGVTLACSQKPALVLCKATLIHVWLEEFERFAPDMKVADISKVLKNPKTTDIPESDVYICGFELYWRRSAVLNYNFKSLIIDESTKVSNPKTKIYKAVSLLSQHVPITILLSGTPAPNNELQYIPQINLINPLLFGRNMRIQEELWGYRPNPMYPKYITRPEKKDELLKLVEQVSISCRKDDVLDLPEQQHIIRKFDLLPAELKKYKQLKKDALLELEDNQNITFDHLLTVIGKLKQFTGGHVLVEGVPQEVSKSKLQQLETLLEETGNNQVVIWTEYRAESAAIKQLLSDAVMVTGETPTDEKADVLQKFTSGQKQYLITNRCLAWGCRLHMVSYAVYYSLPFSAEQYIQSQARIHRAGQTNKCIYYYLLANNTADVIVYKTLTEKSEQSEEFLKYLSSVRV